MSPCGKLVLTMCDNNMVIDLAQFKAEFPWIDILEVKVVCLLLGLSIQGGS